MRHQRALDLGGAEPMAGHVDDVVDPAGDPVIAVLVATRAVAREVLARMGLEIGVDETLMIAEHGAHLAGPRIRDAEIAARRAFEHLALRIHDLRNDAEERPRGRAGLEARGARQRRDKDAAGLRLPPGIDDRATGV